MKFRQFSPVPAACATVVQLTSDHAALCRSNRMSGNTVSFLRFISLEPHEKSPAEEGEDYSCESPDAG